MSEQNKELARRFYDEVLNTGDVDRVADFCTEDVVDHEAPPEWPAGIEGVKAFVRTFHAAFPDLHVTVEDMLADGDRVAARIRMTGTHQGDFMGVPASGSRVEFEAMDIRIADGKAAEHWGVTDNMALMQQIGAIAQGAPAG